MEKNANREYKSTLFTRLFEAPDRRIELYNALTGSSLPKDAPIKDATLQDVLFTGKKNDIAFILDGKLVVLVEHQSTINKNMPLRMLMYIARVYEVIVENDNLYKEGLITIPEPEFYVVYNGASEQPDISTLKLSDAFDSTSKIAGRLKRGLGGLLELEVKIINVNVGHSEAVIRKSECLNGYSVFVGKVREHEKAGCDTEEAIKKAALYCIENGILVQEFSNLTSEVINLLTAEFNMETAKRVWRAESLEEGRVEGRVEGRIEEKTESAKRMLRKGFSIEQIVDAVDMPMAQVISIRNKMLN